MIKFKIIKDNKILEFDSQDKAEQFCLRHGMSQDSIVQNEEIVNIDIKFLVLSKIEKFQKDADKLINELYVENTLMGITIEQSDKMFDDYSDVLLRIKEGAFPTALYRLSLKTPDGFVGQQLIDAWKNKIQEYLT